VQAVGVEHAEEVAPAGVGLFLGEQAVVQATVAGTPSATPTQVMTPLTLTLSAPGCRIWCRA
jgi:hypothetical protein